MAYVLNIFAEDGAHPKVFKTIDDAGRELTRQMGAKPRDGVQLNKRYHDSWGRRLVIEERPAGWTARKETMLGEAYDARECGTATPEQIAFLHHFNF